MVKPESKATLKDIGNMLLEIGTLLMSSGASTSRIRITVNRISEAFKYHTELLITQRALTISIKDKESDHFFSSLKRTSPHGVNFKIVSGISRMSWRVVDEKWTVEQINQELARLTSLPHYPRLLVLMTVSLAGASFCRLFGGSVIEMVVAFIATFAGLFVRQEALKNEFNPYLCVIFASLAASLISGLAVKLNLGTNPELAFATSVLFLVPGVPFINTFTDLIDSNIQNGIVRGVNSLIIAFSIALGLLAAILIYRF
jgi:uncharacterized membrane protein YjjP (DUF1212 family)